MRHETRERGRNAAHAPQDNACVEFPKLHGVNDPETFARPLGAPRVEPFEFNGGRFEDFPRPMSCQMAEARLRRLNAAEFAPELLADVTATVLVLERCQRGEVPPAEAIDSALIRLREWFGGVE